LVADRFFTHEKSEWQYPLTLSMVVTVKVHKLNSKAARVFAEMLEKFGVSVFLFDLFALTIHLFSPVDYKENFLTSLTCVL